MASGVDVTSPGGRKDTHRPTGDSHGAHKPALRATRGSAGAAAGGPGHAGPVLHLAAQGAAVRVQPTRAPCAPARPYQAPV